MNILYFEYLKRLFLEIGLTIEKADIRLSSIGEDRVITLNIGKMKLCENEKRGLIEKLQESPYIVKIQDDSSIFINIDFNKNYWWQQFSLLYDKVICPDIIPINRCRRLSIDLASKIFMAQYSLARCCSVLRDNDYKNERINDLAKKRTQFVFNDIEDDAEINLIKRLIDSQRLVYAEENIDKNNSNYKKTIITYLGLLTADFESFWRKMSIEAKKTENEVHLALFLATACIITMSLANIDIIAIGEIKEQIERI